VAFDFIVDGDNGARVDKLAVATSKNTIVARGATAAS